jgi:hypothetical protein
MERKRMLALGAMTRFSPEEALGELRKVKEHILNLSLRVPIRADFIVHGHNISLSIFRLFEAAERAEAEVDALINAKRSLDAGQLPDEPLTQQEPPQPTTPSIVPPAPRTTVSERIAEPASFSSIVELEPPSPIAQQPAINKQFIEQPQIDYPQENYRSTEIDLGPLEPESMPQDTVTIGETASKTNTAMRMTTTIEEQTTPQQVISKTPTTTGMRLRRALQRSGQTSSRPSQFDITAATVNQSSLPTPNSTENSQKTQTEDEQVFRGGDEEFDL